MICIQRIVSGVNLNSHRLARVNGAVVAPAADISAAALLVSEASSALPHRRFRKRPSHS
jgi:hypothetical protein